MGMTEILAGNVWNTMPAHTHLRRMEAYFYFDLAEGQTISHFMGEPSETRHLFLRKQSSSHISTMVNTLRLRNVQLCIYMGDGW